MRIKIGLTICLLGLLALNPASAADEPIEIEFSGGSAVEFVQAIEHLDTNVLLPENAQQISIPAFHLKITSPDDLYRALTILGSQVTQYCIGKILDFNERRAIFNSHRCRGRGSRTVRPGPWGAFR